MAAAALVLLLVLAPPALAGAGSEYVPDVPDAASSAPDADTPGLGGLSEDEQAAQVAGSRELGAPAKAAIDTSSVEEDEEGSFPTEVLILLALIAAVGAAAFWARKRALAAR